MNDNQIVEKFADKFSYFLTNKLSQTWRGRGDLKVGGLINPLEVWVDGDFIACCPERYATLRDSKDGVLLFEIGDFEATWFMALTEDFRVDYDDKA